MEYKPSKEAKRLPRAIQLDGSWIGVGASITREATPPKLPTILAEATAEQYEALYNMGFTTLVEEIKPIEPKGIKKTKENVV